VNGTCVALLHKSQQTTNRFSGELCAQLDGIVHNQIGGLDRDAQAHEVAIGHDDMAGTLARMAADGQDGETSTIQRMSWIRYLDLVGRIGWVVEVGIMLLSRSTLWIMTMCVRF
jgi:hypothetical protein